MIDLEEILSHYGVEGKVEGEVQGPLIRQIKFKPKAGTKIKNSEATSTILVCNWYFENLNLQSRISPQTKKPKPPMTIKNIMVSKTTGLEAKVVKEPVPKTSKPALQ